MPRYSSSLSPSDTARARQPALRIAQITDTHLYADPDGELLGLNTRRCLQAVIELARTRQPDLVVATGDLTHDASSAAYQQVIDCFGKLGVPVYCLPGNHDEADVLRRSLHTGNCISTTAVQVNDWNLVFMDSTVAGREGGHLSPTELRQLEQALQGAPTTPSLICLHHQPVRIGSRWLDTMAIDNPAELFAIIDRHRQVRAVIWGHVHQQFEQQRKQLQLLSAPSTCVQFLPASDSFAIEAIPPGYRWLDLYSDGRVRSGVERLAAIPGTLDPGRRGY